jgi:hypothetical protein
MIAFDLGTRLATFVALSVAFFRKPGAGFRARNRPCGSAVQFPCHSAAELRDRGMFSPAGRARDLAQVIDYARNYRQNRVDFGAQIQISPDLRERALPPRSEHAEPGDTAGRVEAGDPRLRGRGKPGMRAAADAIVAGLFPTAGARQSG